MLIQQCTQAEASAIPATLVVRESRIRRAAWPLALLALGIACAIAYTIDAAFAIALWPGIFFFGFGLITLAFAVPGMRASNWAMRVTDRGLYINPLSTPNGEHLSPTSHVIFIPFNSIEQAHRVFARKAFIHPNARTHIANHEALGLTTKEPSHLVSLILAAQEPVDTIDPDWIIHSTEADARLLWNGPGNDLVPPMQDVMAHISEHVSIGPDQQETDPYANRQHHAQLEQRLDQLCRDGKTRQAVSVARERFGLSLADAILHVEEIMRHHRAE